MDPGEAEFSSQLEAAKAGANWAWAHIYRHLAPPVTGYLRQRGAREPEDLTHEVFLKVARGIQNFTGDAAAFRSWIFVIAHRLLIDERRYYGRRPSVTHLTEQPNHLDPLGDVESEAVERLVTAEIAEAFNGLTEGQRDVLALRIIAGLSVDETAQVMGKRPGAIKALQHRAVEALRKALDEETVTL